MKKSVSGILAAVGAASLALVFLAAGVGAQKTSSGQVPDNIILANPLFGKLKEQVVVFSHQVHSQDYDLKCEQCHHIYNEKGENIWKEGDRVLSCDQCHNSPYTARGGVPALYNAFHDSCRNCHKEQGDAPQKCQSCHRGVPKGVEAALPNGMSRPPKAAAKAGAVKAGAKSHQTPSGQVANLLVLNNKLFKKKMEGAVRFNHLSHASKYGIKCDRCHHVFVEGKNTWQEGDKVVRCATCHNEPVTQHGKVIGLFQAYHTTCLACHKIGPAKDKGTSCTFCHGEVITGK